MYLSVSSYIVFILIFPLILSSCCFDNNIIGLYVCGAYAVPGTFYPDIKGTEVSYEILENDQYGRIMFSYSAPNLITEQNETVVVICQKLTKDSVYFYEDICYEFDENEDMDFQVLKDRNDWNKPLDIGKMTNRNNKVSLDNVIIAKSVFDIEKIKDICCEKLGIYSPQITEICIDDIQPDGTSVFFLKTDSNKNKRKYFIRVEKEYKVSFYEINDNFYENSKDYIDFKNSD